MADPCQLLQPQLGPAATLATLLYLDTELFPAPGPLHTLFPLPGVISPCLSHCMAIPSCLSSNVSLEVASLAMSFNFFFFFLFGHAMAYGVPGPGIRSSHSCDLSRSSGDAESLTHVTGRCSNLGPSVPRCHQSRFTAVGTPEDSTY